MTLLDIINDIGVYSNAIMTFSGLVMIGFITRWMFTEHSPLSHQVLISWTLITSGYFLRIGYWLVATWQGGEDRYYRCTITMSECVIKTTTHPDWADDYRAFLLCAAVLVLLGNLLFIHYIEGLESKTSMLIVGFILLAATLPTIS